MVAKESKKKVPDEVILFPEANVDGIMVKPWTFAVLLDVNPFVEAIFERLETKGIALSEFQLGFKEIKDIYFAATPQLLKILSISTGKDEDFIRGLDLKVAVKLVYVIWQQNQENLKNAFSLFGKSADDETQDESLSGESKDGQ